MGNYKQQPQTAIGAWSSSFGDSIDVVVSNDDGMGM